MKLEGITVYHLIHIQTEEYLGQGSDRNSFAEGDVFCTFDGWFQVVKAYFAPDMYDHLMQILLVDNAEQEVVLKALRG